LPQFQLAIDAPPPADNIEELFEAGEHYAVGVVAVGTTTTDYTVATQWYGVDFDRVVIYLPEATRPGGILEAFLHGSQSAGFHVYSVKRLTQPEREAALACLNAL